MTGSCKLLSDISHQFGQKGELANLRRQALQMALGDAHKLETSEAADLARQTAVRARRHHLLKPEIGEARQQADLGWQAIARQIGRRK